MPNLAKSQEDILREALREILDRTNREKTRDYYAALNGGILEIHDIANSALNCTPPNPPSNAALREALYGIVDDCRVLDRTDMWEEEGECYYDVLRDIRETVSAALAAPARNCDRTKDEAENLFKNRFGRPWTQTEDELAAWLFDLAEGGAS